MVSRVKQLPERLKSQRLELIRERHQRLVKEAKRVVVDDLGEDTCLDDLGWEPDPSAVAPG